MILCKLERKESEREQIMFQDSVDFVDMEFNLFSKTSMEKQIMHQNCVALMIELKRFGPISKARHILL